MCKNILNVNIPEIATKQLKLQSCDTGRKLVISTNWLPLFEFEADSKVIEELIAPNKGIRIRLANSSDLKPKKVYSREYKSRKNNPLETMLDIRSQKLLNQAFPRDTVRVHIVFKKGIIEITPISNKQAEAIKDFKNNKNKLSTFLACSSGIDAVSLEKSEFKIETLLEYRPHEKRDKNSLCETGALNAIANVAPKYLINEDIMNLDIDKIATLTNSSTHTLFHLSIQCDDFSNVKAKSLKDKSLEDNTSTLDMIIDGINIIQKFNFPTVLIENVKGFATSDIGKMTIARLRRLGYTIHDGTYDARDYSGVTSRVRYYLFATKLQSEFIEPIKQERNTVAIWEQYIEPLIAENKLRDITNTKSYQDGLKTKRVRLIIRDSISSPTVLKSQNRQAKDSLFIYDEVRNKAYFPSNELLVSLMGIEEVNFNCVSGTIESEIVGQSIEVPLHEAILKSVKEHILSADAQLKGRLF